MEVKLLFPDDGEGEDGVPNLDDSKNAGPLAKYSLYAFFISFSWASSSYTVCRDTVSLILPELERGGRALVYDDLLELPRLAGLLQLYVMTQSL